jgi:hypothetical protein
MLGLAGRYADIIGINPNLGLGTLGPDVGPDVTAARYAEKIEWIRRAAGDRFGALELNVFCLHVAISGVDGAGHGRLGPQVGLSAEQAVDSPIALVGSPAQIADTIVGRRERFGISRITVGSQHIEAFAPVVAELAGR